MWRTKTDRDDRVELLERVALFADCTRTELRDLASLSREVRLPSGSVICEQGEAGARFFVLAEGLAHVHIDGRTVASIGAGSFFGEMSIIDGSPRSATV